MTQCQCLPGYVGANGTACGLCPPNTICLSGIKSNCPSNSQSGVGTSTSTACICNPGWYGPPGSICQACPQGSYCTGNTNVQACVTNANNSGANSQTPNDCTCKQGWYGQNNVACTTCPPNSYCTGNGVPTGCSTNSVSLAGSTSTNNCLCSPGYTGANGGPCSGCGIGLYKSSNGSSSCVACLINTFTSTAATITCGATTTCVPGKTSLPPPPLVFSLVSLSFFSFFLTFGFV